MKMQAQKTYSTEQILEDLRSMTRVVSSFTTADAPDGPVHVLITDAKDDQVMMLTLENAYGGLTLSELNKQMGLKPAKPLFPRFDKWLSGWFDFIERLPTRPR